MHKTVDCACHASEHAIRFLFFTTDPGELYLIHYLNAPTFLTRLKEGLKYIFMNRVGMGVFEETILEPQQAYEIRDMMDEFLLWRNKHTRSTFEEIDLEKERQSLLDEQVRRS